MESLHIAVGLLCDGEGRVLISQRRPGTHGEGQWEFPGGKCEAGESVESALSRELAEELGVSVKQAHPFITIRHVYPQREVVLDTWLVTEWNGTAEALEGQPLAWVLPHELHRWSLLQADVPIVHALQLPDLYLFTGPAASPDDFISRLRASLEAGVKLVRLRAPEIDDDRYAGLAKTCLPLCRSAGAELLLDRSPEMVTILGADGLHLTSRRLMSLSERPLAADRWLAASCHSAAELDRLIAIGGDFAVLSPVLPTPGHADGVSLGWSQFRDIVAGRPSPVYGLGGLNAGDLPQAWAHAARGVAAVRGLWKEPK